MASGGVESGRGAVLLAGKAAPDQSLDQMPRPVPDRAAGRSPALALPSASENGLSIARPSGQALALVPSVLGFGMRNAVEIFAAEGIVPVIKGKGGFVVRQAPEPGTPWPDAGKECTLWLEEQVL